jgi:hypothetical protein
LKIKIGSVSILANKYDQRMKKGNETLRKISHYFTFLLLGTFIIPVLSAFPAPPALQITRVGNQANLGWATSNTASFTLFSTTNISSPASWVAVTNAAAMVSNQCVVSVLIANNAQFFQLVPAVQTSIWYVWQGSPTNGPGTSWNNAFHDIQSAANVAVSGGTVLVTNGTYSTGGLVGPDGVTNVVYVTNAITIQSVGGPGVTYIAGGGQVQGTVPTSRCVYFGISATLSGFTLQNGYTGPQAGGGAYAINGAIITNCVFNGNKSSQGGGDYGGVLYNCILMNNGALNLFNGSSLGGGAYGATLSNCSLLNNYVGGFGGGAAYCTLNNCVVAGNRAGIGNGNFTDGGGVYYSTASNCVLSDNSCYGVGSGAGGGAYYGTLNNCIISNNACDFDGGGASGSTLNNCLVIGNTVFYMGFGGTVSGAGGGVASGTLINCIIVGNTAGYSNGGVLGGVMTNCIIFDNIATVDPNCSIYNSLNYCCTTPLAAGPGNISSDPQFVNPTAGNYRLQSSSACVNSGDNTAVVGTTDLDGNPRIVSGTVDMGAYEYQGP